MMCFDIETDGLLDEVTKIYCMSYTYDGEKIETTTRYDVMATLLGNSSCVVGHNIGLYDLPVMEKILGVKFKGLIADTLWLSWYTDPNRIKHGLEDYGEEFGYPKVKVEKEEWKQENLPLMIERCKRDVKINWLVWMKQKGVLEGLYGKLQP